MSSSKEVWQLWRGDCIGCRKAMSTVTALPPCIVPCALQMHPCFLRRALPPSMRKSGAWQAFCLVGCQHPNDSAAILLHAANLLSCAAHGAQQGEGGGPAVCAEDQVHCDPPMQQAARVQGLWSARGARQQGGGARAVPPLPTGLAPALPATGPAACARFSPCRSGLAGRLR